MKYNGICLFFSRAILCYLADKYGQKDSLYPKDVKKRAIVNQRLSFDSGTLYQRFYDYYVSKKDTKLQHCKLYTILSIKYFNININKTVK